VFESRAARPPPTPRSRRNCDPGTSRCNPGQGRRPADGARPADPHLYGELLVYLPQDRCLARLGPGVRFVALTAPERTSAGCIPPDGSSDRYNARAGQAWLRRRGIAQVLADLLWAPPLVKGLQDASLQLRITPDLT
jgi:hypothetical protein